MTHGAGGFPRLRLNGLHAVAVARAERRKARVPADVAQEKALPRQPRVRPHENAVKAQAAFGTNHLKGGAAEAHDARRAAYKASVEAKAAAAAAAEEPVAEEPAL